MPDDRPPVVVIPRAHFRALLVCGGLLAVGAVASSVVAAANAVDSHEGFVAQREQNVTLQQQLDCRYVLSADVNRIQADIFVLTAQALAAARRRDAAAVDLYTTALDGLATELQEASDLRADAVKVCDTEPDNVLG
jgi:hypothetical protein